MSTMKRVREAIEQSHQAIEQTDFAKSLLDGRVTRKVYGLYLSQMWYIHQCLESFLSVCPIVATRFSDELIRTPQIFVDIHALGQVLDGQPILPATRATQQQLQSWAKDQPYALLGRVTFSKARAWVR